MPAKIDKTRLSKAVDHMEDFLWKLIANSRLRERTYLCLNLCQGTIQVWCRITTRKKWLIRFKILWFNLLIMTTVCFTTSSPTGVKVLLHSPELRQTTSTIRRPICKTSSPIPSLTPRLASILIIRNQIRFRKHVDHDRRRQ